MIKISNVKKYYGKVQALDVAHLEINKGDVVVFAGPSGSGKSTMLKTLNGLEPIQAGSIEIDGKPTTAYTAKELATKVGFVSQKFDLFPNYTALENVALAQVKVLGRSKAEAHSKALELLAKLDMTAHQDKLPGQLSGGQQQRVAVARALAMNPEIILFDEPTSALDPELVKSSLRLLEDIAKQGTTMIVVTHEMSFAKHVSNRVVFFDKGGLLMEDTPTQEFFANPRTQRAKDFLNALDLE
ncbi:TPA: amino acid ABC transporter ATP-binding protein [Serratia marcescens]|uniref:Amino acid ABC transporter ATP-binding protein n=1 Tax=Serratia nevei TaxID=2703794 RepID=A0ABT7G5R3_9GAMM|nr:amino acid ABC transporter ATP-binding protein [Serratia nevei]HAU4290916.1 amino acid ABC transporter ATP-binding protein [Serratia marcescens]MDK5169084.1 amino acid ABC transporter ATP-binding protein [Serratia nevei]MDK5298578.1 amino acid ABC transporter ATP-binding protein [Serratia nevei]MEC5887170.1 amino acid ABC transporter ATP-binding protein [Serratia nevei]HAU4299282.1 amino acid ABC transporter ATP-binding protein [Serratia marcescens]